MKQRLQFWGSQTFHVKWLKSTFKKPQKLRKLFLISTKLDVTVGVLGLIDYFLTFPCCVVPDISKVDFLHLLDASYISYLYLSDYWLKWIVTQPRPNIQYPLLTADFIMSCKMFGWMSCLVFEWKSKCFGSFSLAL